MVDNLHYTDENMCNIILVSSKFYFTDEFIQTATRGKYGVIDIYEERLPVSPDPEPSSPAFSDKSD